MRRLQVYTDPLQHALIAAGVTAPLVPRGGRRLVRTAVIAALVIDLDHALAARSVRIRDTTALPVRPRTHSLVVALAAGAAVGAAAGRLHGWVTFGALASHLLHDAGDHAAPTPVLWPFAPARQLGRRRQVVGTLGLALASAAINRAARSSSGGADDGGAATRPRTA
jgi:membrane-bound metal-dependent hydrolase YbcI (DUF457 family)